VKGSSVLSGNIGPVPAFFLSTEGLPLDALAFLDDFGHDKRQQTEGQALNWRLPELESHTCPITIWTIV
jgi:hypothetical protein